MNRLFSYLFLLLLLLVYSNDTFSQTLKFPQSSDFESITTIEHKGTKGSITSKILSTATYDELGRLKKMQYGTSSDSYATYTYIDSTIIVQYTNRDCKWGYTESQNKHEIILKRKEIPLDNGEKSRCPYPPSPAFFGRLNFDSSFQHIPKNYPSEDNIHYMHISKFNEKGETYLELIYWRKSPRSKNLTLSKIKQIEPIKPGLALVRVYHCQYQKVILEKQVIIDTYDGRGYFKSYGNSQFQKKPEDFKINQTYEFDDRGNWIKQQKSQEKQDKVYYIERKIKYRQ